MANRGGDVPKEPKEKFWLYAFRQHLANIQTYSSCLETADVDGNGDYQLVVADGFHRLRFYSGAAMTKDLALFSVPSAVASFYMDSGEAFSRPVIAVATGPYIFMYRNARPLYRFMIPTIPLDPQEEAVWRDLSQGGISAQGAVELLEALVDSGTQTSARTLEFLLMDTDEERVTYAEKMRSVPLIQMDVITCMTSLNLDVLDDKGMGCLVVGTESSMVYVLSNSANEIALKIYLPSPPVFLMTAGCFNVDYRIIISCRDGRIYSVKQGALHSAVIQPDAQPCAVARVDNLVAVATTANTVTYYNLKGKKQQSIYMPASITCMSTITEPITGAARGLVVALSNGELRVYVGGNLQHVSRTYGKVQAMRFCKYGREDSALIVVLEDGSLIVQLLHRNANLTAVKSVETGPPPQQDVALPIPKLSSEFATQTSREKKYGGDMYRIYQYDLSHLRLTTEKSYLTMMNNGVVPTELGNVAAQDKNDDRAESTLRISVVIQGLGPVFKLIVQAKNVGDSVLYGVRVVFATTDPTYTLSHNTCSLPPLLPGIPMSCETLVKLAEGEVKGSEITVVALSPYDVTPLAVTIVDLPEADIIEGL